MIRDAPDVDVVEMALNALPTIYPLQVTVRLVFASYRVTFPVEMGDVPPLIIISSAYNTSRNATEITNGTASGDRLAFELDGAVTHFLDFQNGDITSERLHKEFKDLFSIRCPSSLNNQAADSSIVYAEEFERNVTYSENTLLTDKAFCGWSALSAGYPGRLVQGNMATAEFMCFAYKYQSLEHITMNFVVESDEDPLAISEEQIDIPIISNDRWHYQCIELRRLLEEKNSFYSTVSTFLIINVTITSTLDDAYIDTVTLRNSRPSLYEDEDTINSLDQPFTGSCVFPFSYNGQQHYKCTLDNDNLPICLSLQNEIRYCQSSSVEGVQRLYPKHRLLNDQLSITHLSANRTIDVSFRYTDCQSATPIKPLPPDVSFHCDNSPFTLVFFLVCQCYFDKHCIKTHRWLL